MADLLIRELENAALIVLAPPNIVTHEQRVAAENVILNFRKSKLPYNNCKYLLENSHSDYVIFQAATAIKESVVKEWSLLEQSDIESLRLFLLKYITQNISLQSFAREQILQTVAVILKRGCIEDKRASSEQLFNDLTQLMASGNVTMQLIACSMITSLLNEYSSGSRTSYIGLTWEFHMKCKRFFEENELKRVFLFCLGIVQDLMHKPAPLSTENLAVFNRLLGILEQTLTWTFTPKYIMKRMVGSFQVGQNPVLRPTETWRDVLLNQEFIQLFFHIHTQVHTNTSMSHHSLMSLTQLASLTGDIFKDQESRVQYLSNYLHAFLHMLTSIELCSHESILITNLCKNLVSMFSFTSWNQLDKTLLETFIGHMTKLTCIFGRSASNAEKNAADDSLDQSEAFEGMLEAWSIFIGGFPDTLCELLKPQAIEVFNCYLECILNSPDGRSTSESHSDIDEICEDDRVRYADQLASIGMFGKIAPAHCIPLLTKLLEERCSTLDTQLQQLHGNPQHRCVTLDALYDDIHWLIMIACHVLTEEMPWEPQKIPTSLITYSSGQQSDKNITQSYFMSPTTNPDCIPNIDVAVDSIVRLASTILHIWEVEKRVIDRTQSDVFSPQVVSTSMWFMEKWIAFYLLPDEGLYTESYTQMSETLLSTIGQDTTSGQWAVTYILDKVVFNLTHWSAETEVITDSLNAFISLVSSSERCSSVLKSPSLWTLCQSEAYISTNLSPTCKRLLLKALVTAGFGSIDSHIRDEYWKIVLMPIYTKFDDLVQPNFCTTCQSSSSKQLALSLLESMCGIIDTSISTNSTFLFNFLRPLLPNCAKLLEYYHNYDDIIPVILEIFSLIVQRQLAFLSQSDSQYLYEQTLAAIQLYSKHHIGRHMTLKCDDLEESKFSDLSVILETLIGLLNKEFIDLGDEDLTSKGEKGVDISEVILYGLHTIIPVMTADLLKFPSLCWLYFKLISMVAETYPEKFPDIPSDLLDTLMKSVDVGLTTYGEDATKMSLHTIEALSRHCVASNLPLTSQIRPALSHFLKSVMYLVLADTFDMDLMDIISTCFFTLVCSNLDEYHKIANELVQSQTDESNRYRLHAAFTALTPPDFTPTLVRSNMVAFLDRFCQFLINVRAFVCIR